MSQYLKFKCIFCGQSMECDPKHAGRHIKCPACEHKITVPGAKPAADYQKEGMTWTGNVATPEVSTPTRYQKPPEPPKQG